MPGAWGTAMDVGGVYCGTLSGAMNMWGNFAGFLAPVVTGYILGGDTKLGPDVLCVGRDLPDGDCVLGVSGFRRELETV